MKEIKLTKGQVALVDDEDYEYLMQWKWSAQLHHTGSYYAIRAYQKSKNGNSKSYVHIRMHRDLMGATKGIQVDHINRNTLDNQRTNLRLCNNSQNQFNSKIRKDNKVGFKGVFKSKNKFRAMIYENKNRIHLGYFESPIDAAIAYNKASIKYHGEFAFLNEIPK